jgi:hypothetical protein
VPVAAAAAFSDTLQAKRLAENPEREKERERERERLLDLFCLHRQISYWFGCTLDPRVCLYWCLGADNIPVLSVSVFDLERERERERELVSNVFVVISSVVGLWLLDRSWQC